MSAMEDKVARIRRAPLELRVEIAPRWKWGRNFVWVTFRSTYASAVTRAPGKLPALLQHLRQRFATLLNENDPGANATESLRPNQSAVCSCLAALRKQGYGMLDVLRRAFNRNPVQPTNC